MSKIKSCPSCNRSYSDLSYSFCLADGVLLSASYESIEIQNENEVETRISLRKREFDEPTLVQSSEEVSLTPKQSKLKIPPSEECEPDFWKYEKGIKTKDKEPVASNTSTSDRPFHKWTSSDYVREITFQITGNHTFHAQENLKILKNHMNQFIEDSNKVFMRSAWQNGKGNFYNNVGKCFSYNFQKTANPTKDGFLNELKDYLNW